MGLINLFNSRPVIKLHDIPNEKKVAEFTVWFLKNEKFVNTLSAPSNNAIFNEGYRPLYDKNNNPEDIIHTDNLVSWFIVKIYIDLNSLRDSPKSDWKKFIDALVHQGKDTLMKSARLAENYHLDLNHFIYEKEMRKFSVSQDMEEFKTNYLRDNVIGAEIRILAWLYLNYFSEQYE